jgi:hypothetical protein
VCGVIVSAFFAFRVRAMFLYLSEVGRVPVHAIQFPVHEFAWFEIQYASRRL